MPVYVHVENGERREEVLTEEQGATDRQMVREHENLCAAIGGGEDVNALPLYAPSIEFLGKGLQTLPSARKKFWVELLARDSIKVAAAAKPAEPPPFASRAEARRADAAKMTKPTSGG